MLQCCPEGRRLGGTREPCALRSTGEKVCDNLRERRLTCTAVAVGASGTASESTSVLANLLLTVEQQWAARSAGLLVPAGRQARTELNLRMTL